jgi:shikimate kinase
MKIILIGYRAAGKTTVGRLLSQQLDWPYLDVDREIEARCGGRTIKEIYEEDGDTFYRDVESTVTADLCRRDACVISFGAGTIMRPDNQSCARRDSLVVYLETTAQELWRRMQADPDTLSTRPNLASGGIEEVVEILAHRDKVYRRCAELILDATLPPQRLVELIAARQST